VVLTFRVIFVRFFPIGKLPIADLYFSGAAKKWFSGF